MRRLAETEWRAEAISRFGEDPLNWEFVCPSCGHIASIKDWRDANAPDGSQAYSCVGRYIKGLPVPAFGRKGGPCDYAGGGLIGLNPVAVTTDEGKELHIFEFAEAEGERDGN